jgi:hypothetical protein
MIYFMTLFFVGDRVAEYLCSLTSDHKPNTTDMGSGFAT